MSKRFPTILFLLLYTLPQCQTPTSEIDSALPYDFTKPSAVLDLHKDLREISGLAWWNTDTLVAIEDENAELYFLSTKTGEILLKTDFGEDGDYEGIAVVERTVFVLRSDGDVYRVEDPTDEDPDTDKNETDLSDDNDTEGLHYDQANGVLLIACKAMEDDYYGYRTLFELTPGDKDIKKKPFMLIDEEALLKQLHLTYGDRWGSTFKPSGLSRHPHSGDLYIVSAANNLLAAFDENQDVKQVLRLNFPYTNQMEGICFAPDGTVFISSEGGTGKVAVFKIKVNE